MGLSPAPLIFAPAMDAAGIALRHRGAILS